MESALNEYGDFTKPRPKEIPNKVSEEGVKDKVGIPDDIEITKTSFKERNANGEYPEDRKWSALAKSKKDGHLRVGLGKTEQEAIQNAIDNTKVELERTTKDKVEKNSINQEFESYKKKYGGEDKAQQNANGDWIIEGLIKDNKLSYKRSKPIFKNAVGAGNKYKFYESNTR